MSVYGLERKPRTYKCTVCSARKLITTNHEGTCLDHCVECSWKSIGFGPGVQMFGTWHRLFEFVKETSLFKEVVELGIPYSNHYSDLYLPNTEQVRGLLKKYDKRGECFQNQVEGGIWIDVPFSYEGPTNE